MKRAGGRRYYRPDDVALLRGIHHLLYGEGYTIRGVQRILKEQGVKFVENVWQPGAEQPPHGAYHGDEPDEDAADQTPRRGRLFDRLQHLAARRENGGAIDEEEPEMAHHDANDSSAADLSREDLRKLQSTLFELGECRKLLDAAVEKKS
jgi:DNA-binding transcriptional MerR regulator